jgi:hypothetical protein
MSSDEVADHVFNAISEERFCILTHPEELHFVRDRVERLLNLRNPRDPASD